VETINGILDLEIPNSSAQDSSMAEKVGEYEKLGSFYQCKEHDTEKSEVTEDLLLCDSKDLVTQGVVMGMTGP